MHFKCCLHLLCIRHKCLMVHHPQSHSHYTTRYFTLHFHYITFTFTFTLRSHYITFSSDTFILRLIPFCCFCRGLGILLQHGIFWIEPCEDYRDQWKHRADRCRLDGWNTSRVPFKRRRSSDDHKKHNWSGLSWFVLMAPNWLAWSIPMFAIISPMCSRDS